jgi:hypothetical protein
MERNIQVPHETGAENIEEHMGAEPIQDPSLMDSAMSDQTPVADDDLAAEDQLEELSELMDNIEAKYREMNAEIFSSENQGESIKKELVKDVFVALQDAGIDISDADAIREFLDLLEESNPDLYEMFISAFDSLLGDKQVEGMEGMQEAMQGEGEVPPIEEGGLTEPTADLSGSGMGEAMAPASSQDLSGMMSPPASPPEAGMDMGLSQKFPNLSGR